MHSALQGVQGPGGGSFSDQDVCGSKQAHSNAKLQSPKASKFTSLYLTNNMATYGKHVTKTLPQTTNPPWESLTCPRKAPSISAPEGIKETQFGATETCHQLSAIGRCTSISCSWIICAQRQNSKNYQMKRHGTSWNHRCFLHNPT